LFRVTVFVVTYSRWLASSVVGRIAAVVVVVGAASGAATAHAAGGDAATVDRITLLNRKAVDAYQHLEFDTAVQILNEALALSDQAGLKGHPIRARTFVTLGIVTLGGLKQKEPALKYFRKALRIQPEIRLSPGLANPEIQAAFDEAISSLGSEPGDDLPPEKALVHEPVAMAPAGKVLPIRVAPDRSLEAINLVLSYRAGTDTAFAALPMQKGPNGVFAASIPASATAGAQVVYFIEARKDDGTVVVARGSAASPLVVSLLPAAGASGGAGTAGLGTAGTVTTPGGSSAAAGPQHRFFIAVMGGTGAGFAGGTGDETRGNVSSSSSLDWAGAAHLAPEIGYFVDTRLLLSVQARLQFVSGATEYHVPNAQMGECGSDHICSPFGGAFAGLLKASWFLSQPDGAFQPYLSLAAGGGNIRHLAKVVAPPTCGSNGNQACTDTVAAGPVLFGPAFGFTYKLSDAVDLVAEVQALIGVPTFTANADVNVGLAFQL
jgi:hypothetical protein